MSNIIIIDLFFIVTLPVFSIGLYTMYSKICEVKYDNKLLMILIYLLYPLSIIVNKYFIDYQGKFILWNLIFALLSMILYFGSIRKRIIIVSYTLFLYYCCESIIPMIEHNDGVIFSLLISKLLFLILVLISVRLLEKINYDNKSKTYLFVLYGIAITSVIFIIDTWKHSGVNKPYIVPSISIGLLILNTLMIIIFDKVISLKFVEVKNRQLEEQNEYYLKQYETLKQDTAETKSIKHDLNNILIGFKLNIQSNNNDEVIKVIDKLVGKTNNLNGVCNTGNTCLDYIINHKHAFIKDNNIKFSVKCSIPSNLLLNTELMCIILGNSIDNAIEACLENHDENNYIDINFNYLNQSLFFNITNSHSNVIKTNMNKELVSTKKGRDHHGIGLKSIEKHINLYNGIYDFSYSESEFSLEVVLFNIDREPIKNSDIIKPLIRAKHENNTFSFNYSE